MASIVMARQFGYLLHFTPTAEQRKAYARSGIAMPDGSFYIRNRDDLSNAINAVGRATPNASESDVARRNSVRRHIMKRARTMKMTSMIPDTWNRDGSLKQSAMQDQVPDFLAHYGVLGMKWGVRKRESSGPAAPSHGHPFNVRAATLGHPSLTAPRPKGADFTSTEAARAMELRARVRRSGTRSLTNRELQDLVTRMNLERQYSSLDPSSVKIGKRYLKGILMDVGKQQATSFVIKNAPKVAAWVLKKTGELAVKALVAA